MLTLGLAFVTIVNATLAEDEFTDEDIRNLQGETVSTRVNIFQKLKESLGLAIVGCLLICCMPLLIWKNEGRHVREVQRIQFCKNEATAVDW